MLVVMVDSGSRIVMVEVVEVVVHQKVEKVATLEGGNGGGEVYLSSITGASNVLLELVAEVVQVYYGGGWCTGLQRCWWTKRWRYWFWCGGNANANNTGGGGGGGDAGSTTGNGGGSGVVVIVKYPT